MNSEAFRSTNSAIQNPISADIEAIDKIEAVRRILEVVCRATGMGFSAVARVTEAQWTACAVRDEIDFGLVPGDELPIHNTFCDQIRRDGHLIVIDHVATDATFCSHPIPQMYGFQSYISVPIHFPDGRFFGTLCAIGDRPARLDNPETIGMIQLFADLIGQYLSAQERMAAQEAALLSEREAAKLREQFIAVLGHDLRNPLGAIGAGVAVLRTMQSDPESGVVLDMIQRSTTRMGQLIGDVLDFARGRLGGGLGIQKSLDSNLENALGQVVAELQSTSPHRMIHRDFSMHRPVFCDSARLAQMLSNLLANALTHSPQDSPVWVGVQSSDAGFELWVTNQSAAIEPHIMEQLFEPFARGTARPGGAGLGLGLYISSEIARAHGGQLKVETEAETVCFRFKMPVETPVVGA